MLRIARTLKWSWCFKTLKKQQLLRFLPNTHFALNKPKFGFTFIKNNQM